MNDYRVADNANHFKGVLDRKNSLRTSIKRNHPRSKNHYTILKSRSDPLHKEFARVYGWRCGYCGVSSDIILSSDFEIDHFICKSSSNECVNDLSNLILSCHFCNSKKSDHMIVGPTNILCPDYDIGGTFYRDDMMHIRITDVYQSNKDVCDFYDRLCFGDERRRIEYLLLSLMAYKECLRDVCLKRIVAEIIEIIRKSYCNNH